MREDHDIRLLFATRVARLFSYGFLSVVLMLYLSELGLPDNRIGLIFTLALFGDTVISLGITTSADRVGRKSMLVVGAGLMALAGVLFAVTRNFVLLLIAATVGVISPSGNEVGPFLSIEQASLAQLTPSGRRTSVFAWYNLVGSFATAIGALVGGALAQTLQNAGLSTLSSYRAVVIGYASMGGILALLFAFLSLRVEAPVSERDRQQQPAGSFYKLIGIPKSGPVVLRLSALFSLDAFAGGFVLQSIVAYWFHVRFGVPIGLLGGIFFGGNILAGISALTASRLARRIGLIRTMVFTHIPSNIFLIMVPLMPSLRLAVTMLLLRFSISQMDVPTRQSYTMAVVEPGERAAAGGVTAVARSAGSSFSPVLAGRLTSAATLSVPFFLAGGLKIVYDLLLYRSFRTSQAGEPPADSIASRK